MTRNRVLGDGLRRVLGVSLSGLLLATLFAAAEPPAATQASSHGNRPAVVSAELKRELAESPNGKARAVITAWRRADLATIKRELGIAGASLRQLPMILAPGITRDQLAALQRSPLVRSVWHERTVELLMEDSTWLTGARYAWGPPLGTNGLDYEGRDVEIAVIDTGIDGMHEDADNLIEFCDATATVTGDREELPCSPQGPGNLPLGTGDPRTDSTDDEGHGTHVSGSIAGTGHASGGIDAPHSTIGVAPSAKLRVYSSNILLFLASFQILASYDDLTFKKATGYSATVAVSNSWGGGTGADYNPDDPFSVAIKEAYDVGVLSVFAAGNSGPEHNTLSDTCISPWAVCVGATTKADSVVMFSSRGRPTEPADTNRNGIVGDAGDMASDNHDRRLAQQLNLGLYRPTIVAPGVNINSMAAAPAGPCREGTPPESQTDCYVSLSGTSMATPTVSGAIAVIVEAYRDGHGGRTPSPAIITEILERSAQKLPGWEAEEQGAGRLAVVKAVRQALAWRPAATPKPPVFGTPSPPYVAGKAPGDPATKSTVEGCAPVGGWASNMFVEHKIRVPLQAERLRVTINFDDPSETANLYARLWRPGVDPDAMTADGRERTMPDQESLGLLGLGVRRFLDVRAPEEGMWTLRVYHRVGGAPGPGCHEYEATVEIPIASRTPTVAITSPAGGTTFSDRFITFEGTASYPARWDGVSIFEVPGTRPEPTNGGGGGPDTRPVLYFHGTAADGCSGVGEADLATCGGPFLLPEGPHAGPPAVFSGDPIFDCTGDRCPVDPNWIWELTEPTVVDGPMTVEFWASCGACQDGVLSADWWIRLWADGRLAVEKRVTDVTPTTPNVPERLTATIDVPETRAERNFVLHVDPVYFDSQSNTKIYYDSTGPCSTDTSGACDSLVRMPVGSSGGDDTSVPTGVSVTDLHTRLRLSWQPADNAVRYRIHRSTNPSFTPNAGNLLATTAGVGCTSPRVSNWPSANRPGVLCYTDTKVAKSGKTTYYYRIVAIARDGSRTDSSGMAYGRPTRFDRDVWVKADQVYGQGYWQAATPLNRATTKWQYVWDTFDRPAADGGAGVQAQASDTVSWRVWARSFEQGIGSAKVSRAVRTEGEAPLEPRDPVVALTMTAPLEASPGTTFRYIIEWRNLGPEPVTDGRLTDVLPRQLAFLGASGGGTWNKATRTVTWTVGTVPVGGVGRASLKVRVRPNVPAGTVITNSAEFTAPLTTATPAIAVTTVR